MSDSVRIEGLGQISEALHRIADEIHVYNELTRERQKFLYPEKDPVPAYQCSRCGSPKWHPGGMGMGFKLCDDCGLIGEQIKE